MDEVWYVEAADAVRLPRLIARHVAAGKAPEAAESWAKTSDQANADLIATTRTRADLIIDNATDAGTDANLDDRLSRARNP